MIWQLISLHLESRTIVNILLAGKHVEVWQVQSVQSPAPGNQTNTGKQISIEMMRRVHIQRVNLCILGGFSLEGKCGIFGRAACHFAAVFFASCVECKALQQTRALTVCINLFEKPLSIKPPLAAQTADWLLSCDSMKSCFLLIVWRDRGAQ